MAASGADAVIARLEARLAVLESRLACTSAEPKRSGEIIDTLVNVSQKLKQLEGKSKSVRQIFGRLNELENCLEMCHADTFLLSEEAQVEAVLAGDTEVSKMCRQLEQLDQLRPVLESEHLRSKVGSQLGSKMSQMCHVNASQEILVEESLQHTKQLLDKYNSIIDGLSLQLLCWSDLIANMEKAVAARPLS